MKPEIHNFDEVIKKLEKMKESLYFRIVKSSQRVFYLTMLSLLITSLPAQVSPKKITDIRIEIDTNLINSNYLLPGDTIPVAFFLTLKKNKEKMVPLDKQKGVIANLNCGKFFVEFKKNMIFYYIIVPIDIAEIPDKKMILNVTTQKRPEIIKTLEIKLSYPENISKLILMESSSANILPGSEILIQPQLITSGGRVQAFIDERMDLLVISTTSGLYANGIFTVFKNIKNIINDQASLTVELAGRVSLRDSAIIEVNYKGTQVVDRNAGTGENGTDGDTYKNGFLSGNNGYSGGEGIVGKDGISASDYSIYAYAYQNNFNGDTLLSVKICNNAGHVIGDYIVNTNGGLLEFHCQGGTGGNGGNGGDGQNGKDAKKEAGLFKLDRTGVDGGNGGNGGKGGNGGNGGNIFLYLDPSAEQYQNNFLFILSGGSGGNGGSGGSGGTGGDGLKAEDGQSWELEPGVNGKSGSSGIYGTSGTTGKVTVEIKSLK